MIGLIQQKATYIKDVETTKMCKQIILVPLEVQDAVLKEYVN